MSHKFQQRFKKISTESVTEPEKFCYFTPWLLVMFCQLMVAFNMSRFICNLFTNPDGGVVSNILKYSTDFLMDMLPTNSTSLVS